MEIKHSAHAGTLESSDLTVTLQPATAGISIALTSSVAKQFGDQIKQVVTATLQKLGIQAATVKVNDKGALNCTIKARTIVAAYRAADKTDYDWEEINSWIN